MSSRRSSSKFAIELVVGSLKYFGGQYDVTVLYIYVISEVTVPRIGALFKMRFKGVMATFINIE